MAKIYGLFGAMTGKLADTVMSVRNGEQIARKYQPVVFNPSTPAQVAQRAKLKLLSQLSAVLAPSIAMRRVGSVSARNMFTKVNFPLTTYNDNVADITLTNIQLTTSAVALPLVTATPGTGGEFTAALAYPAPNLDKVVFVAFLKDTNDRLRLYEEKVADITSEGVASATFEISDAYNVVVLAYGIRFNNEDARVAFGNLTAIMTESVGKIIVTSTLTENDITLTETRGVALNRVQSREDDTKKKSK